MAINYELINKGGISLGTNFELLSEKPLDSRLVVPSLDGLQNYIDSAAAYEGMIAYVSSEKKHYEVKIIDGVLSYRPFGLTEAELNDLITNATTAAMEFKGATATLPENPAKGDMYKVAGENISIKIDDVDAKLGDSIVYDGEKWFLIPSGDDIEDTWRPVEGVNNDATLKFVDGDKTVAAVAADGTIKYNHATVAAPADVTAEGDEKTRTYITAVETDGYGHITGYKTATENVEDTNTEYTFESQVESSSVYFNVTPNTEGATEETIYVDAYSKNEADGKFVAKETGKSLVSDTEIARLAEVDNYDDEEVRGLIGDNAQAIEDLTTYVGTIPTDEKYADITNVISYVNKKAEETLSAAQGGSSETAASVKQQLDNYKSENDTRVKAVEDDIAAINNADTGILKQAKDYADGLAGNYDEAGAAAGVQTALEAEIAKKVDKESYEDDKATFATKTELGDVDKKFADYKTAADQKLIDDAQDAEIAKKVDKVEGKSLVDDAEITKLAGVSEGANKVEASTNGKIKIDGVDTVVYTHPDKHTVSEISDFETKIASYDYATKTEAQGYADAKDEAIAAAKKAGDDAQKTADDITAYVGTFTASEGVDTVVKYIDAKTANIASDERVNDIDDRVKAIEDDYLKAEHKTALEGLITAEQQRAEGIEGGLRTDVDAIKGDYLKAADKTELEGKIAAEETRATGVESGLDARIKAVEDDYLKASDKEDLQIQINTIMNNPDAEGAINSINEFTQYVKDHGTIAEGFRADIDKNKEDIAANTKAVGDEAARADAAEKALAGRLDTLEAIDHEAYVAADTALKTELEGAIADGDADTLEAAKKDASDKDVVVLSEAQKYADQTKADAEAKAAELDAALKSELQGEIDADVKVVSDALAQYKTNNDAVVALKANTADVYAKTETYTKAEVEALISAAHQWGEF